MTSNENNIKITSVKNPVIVEVLELISSGSEDGYLIEGEKFINDLPNGALKMVFTTDTVTYCDIIGKAERSFFVGQNVIDKLSGAVSQSKIIAVARKIPSEKPDKLIALDCVQDPGNVGTIIRTAAAFGFGVVCGFGSANPFLPKAVRASAGAVCKNFVVRAELSEYLHALSEEGYKIVGGTLKDESKKISSEKMSEKTAVVIGNEGKGISQNVIKLCDELQYIPILREAAESLNAAVAAALFCYEYTRDNFNKT